MTSIDWSKPVQTKDGRKVRVLCRDRKTSEEGKQNVATLIDMGEYESWQFYDTSGKCGCLNLDLINVSQKRWVCLFLVGDHIVSRDWPNRTLADADAQELPRRSAAHIFLKTVEVVLP